jgi:nucleolar protein 58
MLVLYETAAGYCLFKVLDDGHLKNSDDIYKYFESPEEANKAYFFF